MKKSPKRPGPTAKIPSDRELRKSVRREMPAKPPKAEPNPRAYDRGAARKPPEDEG